MEFIIQQTCSLYLLCAGDLLAEGYTASALVELTVGNIVWYMLEVYIAYTEGSNEGVDVSACDREDMEK